MSKTTVVASPLVSVTDAAAYLSVSTRTIRRLIQQGEIPIVRIGGAVRIARASLNAYIAIRTESESWQSLALKVTASH